MNGSEPLPDLVELAANAEQAQWAADLPFRYDVLRSEVVIAILHRLAKWQPAEGQSAGTLRAKLAGAGSGQVEFRLRLGKNSAGKHSLAVEKHG